MGFAFENKFYLRLRDHCTQSTQLTERKRSLNLSRMEKESKRKFQTLDVIVSPFSPSLASRISRWQLEAIVFCKNSPSDYDSLSFLLFSFSSHCLRKDKRAYSIANRLPFRETAAGRRGREQGRDRCLGTAKINSRACELRARSAFNELPSSRLFMKFCIARPYACSIIAMLC